MTDDSTLDKGAQGWSLGRPGVTQEHPRPTQGSPGQGMLRPRAERQQPWGQEEQRRHSPTQIAFGKPGPTDTKEIRNQETNDHPAVFYTRRKHNPTTRILDSSVLVTKNPDGDMSETKSLVRLRKSLFLGR